MSNFEYKCVAGPTAISVKNEKETKLAVNSFETIINSQAVDGWEYVGIDEFSTHEAQGCFGGETKVTTLKMIIFKRPR